MLAPAAQTTGGRPAPQPPPVADGRSVGAEQRTRQKTWPAVAGAPRPPPS